MEQTLKNVWGGVYRTATSILGSKYFFYGILAVITLQAMWYTFSFRPWINDEGHHIAVIQVYSEQYSPFISSQDSTQDHLGQLTRNGSYLFYYLMSWPLRVLEVFTQNQMYQVIGLRLVCTVCFLLGVVLYRRALLEIGKLSLAVVHGLLLFFAIMPTVALLAGTVNYDNVVFLLYGAILVLLVRLLKSSTLRLDLLSALLISGLLMSIVKWTALTLLLPVLLITLYDTYKKCRPDLVRTIKSAWHQLSRYKAVALIAGLIVVGGLFIERPITNLIRYGTPAPSCQQVIGETRCQEFRNHTAYKQLEAEKPVDFHAYDPMRFIFMHWLPLMSDKVSNLLEIGRPGNLPLIKILYYGLAYVWIGAVLVALRQLLTQKFYRVLLAIIVIYLGVLLIKNYAGYIHYGVPVAIRPRYIVPVLPSMLYMGAAAILLLFGKFKKVLLATFVLLVVVTVTQGGSIITHLFTAPERAYWPCGHARSINSSLRAALNPIVRE